jgi:hypothetical protein
MQVSPGDDDVRGIGDMPITRRGLLRGSLLGITGLGVAGALAGCGDDDDKEENPVVTGKGAEEVGETPGIGNETGIGTGGGSGEGETEEAATPGT